MGEGLQELEPVSKPALRNKGPWCQTEDPNGISAFSCKTKEKYLVPDKVFESLHYLNLRYFFKLTEVPLLLQ